MSRNFDIARSRLRNGWCEFSARLLSHLPQVWADAFGPRRCSARVRSTQRSETCPSYKFRPAQKSGPFRVVPDSVCDPHTILLHGVLSNFRSRAMR